MWRRKRIAWWLILVLAIVLRLLGDRRHEFWYDEIITATLAVQSPLELVVSVLRFDIHPPLYYLQLHLWAQIDQWDSWLILNSVMWSVAAVASLFVTARQMYGERVALVAMLLFASMPVVIEQAQNLRMYSMMMFLSIWAWYFTCRYFAEGRPRELRWATFFTLLIVYSHAMGILTAACLGLFGLLNLWHFRPHFAGWKSWMMAQLVIGVLSLPVLVNSSVRSVSQVSVPAGGEVAASLTSLLFGRARAESVLLWCLTFGLLMFLVAVSWRRPLGRPMIWSLVLAPPIVSLVVSHAVTPIWHLRGLLFVSPFLALSLALGLLPPCNVDSWNLWKSKSREVLCAALVLLLLALSLHDTITTQKSNNFEAAAQDIARDTKSGDVVYAPIWVHFWGIAWYLVGPDWGSPLEIQDMETTGAWAAVLKRMGPDWQRRLKLAPQTNRLDAENTVLVIGESSAASVGTEAQRVFLVTNYSMSNPPEEFDNFELVESRDYVGLVVMVLNLKDI